MVLTKWHCYQVLLGLVGVIMFGFLLLLFSYPTRRSLFSGIYWSTCTWASVSANHRNIPFEKHKIINVFLLIGITYDLNLYKEITKRPACTD